ncbi:MAG: thioesterase domain-containing protein [Scytonema sp. PMC 1069.18]|nr:thioesterase domain-containing protein [Scytonema sp. PMC 1069.18]MEC4885422.1 thioesterase domain-containing protein [Scytonema sp. PMC 1070.18]
MITQSLWITCPKPNPRASLRLFCFPYAGGGASIFRLWSEQLPTEIEVCSIQFPGRESRLKEPLFTQLLLLAETIAPVLRPYLNIPFAFFGHSMGALVAFEVARQLRRLGDSEPVHLFVSSRPAPQIPIFNPIHQLPDSDFIAELRDRYNAIPDILLQNPEMMELFLPILRADITILETYSYKIEPLLNYPISAFGGLQDNCVSQNDISAWRDQTCQPFTLQMFNGGHFFLKEKQYPLLQTIGQELIEYIDLCL